MDAPYSLLLDIFRYCFFEVLNKFTIIYQIITTLKKNKNPVKHQLFWVLRNVFLAMQEGYSWILYKKVKTLMLLD